MAAVVSGDAAQLEQAKVASRVLKDATEPLKDGSLTTVDQLRGLNLQKAIVLNLGK